MNEWKPLYGIENNVNDAIRYVFGKQDFFLSPKNFAISDNISHSELQQLVCVRPIVVAIFLFKSHACQQTYIRTLFYWIEVRVSWVCVCEFICWIGVDLTVVGGLVVVSSVKIDESDEIFGGSYANSDMFALFWHNNTLLSNKYNSLCIYHLFTCMCVFSVHSFVAQRWIAAIALHILVSKRRICTPNKWYMTVK